MKGRKPPDFADEIAGAVDEVERKKTEQREQLFQRVLDEALDELLAEEVRDKKILPYRLDTYKTIINNHINKDMLRDMYDRQTPKDRKQTVKVCRPFSRAQTTRRIQYPRRPRCA